MTKLYQNPKGRFQHFIVAACLVLLPLWNAFTQEIPKEYLDVLTLLSRKGDFKDNVFKLNIPRTDLQVSIAGVATPTPFGFGGWLAMTKGDMGMEVMMGDLVLLEDEVNPVMSALLDNGLEVTALHNHFFWEEPHIFYMHVHGHGTAAELAQKVKPALNLIGHVEPSGNRPRVDSNSAARRPVSGGVVAGKLDTDKLATIIGYKGEQMGAVYKITIGRKDIDLREMGAVINARMGLNTWAAFFGSDDKAVVAGDIAMQEDEVTSVLKALRKNDLDVVAIHHHMTEARPMIIFLHYWGSGRGDKLAAGVRAALDQLGKQN
jgi:hypothetical protein